MRQYFPNIIKNDIEICSFKQNLVYQIIGTLIYVVAFYFFFLKPRIVSFEGIGFFATLASLKMAERLYIVKMTLDMVFAVVRKVPVRSTLCPYDVVVAGLGTFVTLLFEPCGTFIPPYIGKFIVTGLLFGVVLQIIALSSLNLSFSVIPADRGIKSKGFYRFVRHPLYACYLVSISCYLLLNLSLFNFCIFCLWILFEVLRIFNEERLLSENPDYVEYKKAVKYRIIPGIY